MHLRYALVAAFAWSFMHAATARAQDGFVKTQGEAYVKLAFTNFASDDFYNTNGDQVGQSEVFTQRNLVLYGEYGIIENLTAIVNFPVLRTNAFANTNTVYGIGDLWVGLKYGVKLGGFHLAASVNPEFPTGNSSASVSFLNEQGQELSLILPTGDGEFNVWSWLGVSRGMSLASWASGYASLGAGVNLRTKGLSHQLGFRAEVGSRLFENLFVQVQSRAQIVPSDDLAFGGFILGEGTEFITMGALIGFTLPSLPLTIEAEWVQPVALQANLYSGPQFALGLSFSDQIIR